MSLTPKQIEDACDCSASAARAWCEPLNAAMAAFEITTPARRAAFLAQISHESGRLRHVREIWGPTPTQQRYEGRKDLGNVRPGDGSRYRGRGLIQTTGRANYAATRDGLAKRMDGVPDFEADPAALEQQTWAALSAAWYWHSRGLNELADRGDFKTITRRINGGLNGYDDRVALWNGARGAVA